MRRPHCEGSKQPATPAESLTKAKNTGVCAKCGGVFRVTMDNRPYPHKVPPAKLESEAPARATDQDLGL
jgi:hypothetical protein